MLLLLLTTTPVGGGGGGGGGLTSISMHIGYVPCDRPPFSALNFRSGAYHFHKLPKKIRSGASPFDIFGGFCRSGDHHFQNFFNFNSLTRSSPPTAGSARTQSVRQRRGLAGVPEIRIFTLKTDQARAFGDSHFHAQNGSSSFRSPAFSRSKRLKLVPEPHIFTLDRELVPEPLPIFHFAAAHAYQNLGWVYTPSPSPRDYILLILVLVWRIRDRVHNVIPIISVRHTCLHSAAVSRPISLAMQLM